MKGYTREVALGHVVLLYFVALLGLIPIPMMVIYMQSGVAAIIFICYKNKKEEECGK